MIDTTINAVLLAFVVSLIAAPLVYRFLLKIQSRQKVSEHVPEHAEKQGTPTMGGLIVLLGLFATLWFVPSGERVTPMVLLLGFGLIGFLDDYIVPKMLSHTRGLGWKQKIVLQIVVALGAFALGGVNDPFAFAILTFFILFFANAYNFSDGMDTLAGGLAVLMGIGFMVIAWLAMPAGPAQTSLMVLMAAMCTAFIPFLFYNAPPAKMFMGDVGALPLGALLGWAFLEIGRSSDLVANQANLWAAIIVSLIMVVELVPVPIQIASVKLRKGKRVFPKTPVHHAFQSAGWPETRVVWMFHLAQAVLVVVAICVVWRFAK